MKVYLKILPLFVACLLGFSACHDDDLYGDNVYETVWGTVSEIDNASIYGDDNRIYNVVENRVSSIPLYEGERVIINFNLLNPLAARNDIRLIAFESITDNNVLVLSELSEPEKNQLGADPVYILSTWLGGYRNESVKSLYLNMTFQSRHSDLVDSQHVISAVLDDGNSTDTHKFLNIYCARNTGGNDMSDYTSDIYYTKSNTSESQMFSRASFDLKNIVPLDASEVKVTINWVDYVGNSKSTTLTYRGN